MRDDCNFEVSGSAQLCVTRDLQYSYTCIMVTKEWRPFESEVSPQRPMIRLSRIIALTIRLRASRSHCVSASTDRRTATKGGSERQVVLTIIIRTLVVAWLNTNYILDLMIDFELKRRHRRIVSHTVQPTHHKHLLFRNIR